MIISEKIFELIRERGMTQKEFSIKTGIAQGSISDWKRKNTNPSADKILIICKVLNVTPEELLSATDTVSKRSNPSDYLVVDKSSEIGSILMEIQEMDETSRNRIIGYINALKEVK